MIVKVHIFRCLSAKPNLLCSVIVPHFHQVLVKGFFIEISFAHIKHLQRSTMLEKIPESHGICSSETNLRAMPRE